VTSLSSRSPLVASGRDHYAKVSANVPANFELLAAMVGVYGLIRDSLGDPAPLAWLNHHSLFGLLLWLSVIARFHHRLNHHPGMRATDLRAFVRHLSRRVYVLLYGLMFLHLSISALHCKSPGASLAVAAHFQCYLAYGFSALLGIHALAALWLRLLRGGLGNGRLTKREPASPKRQG
jgi:hypothetical protein